MIDEAREEKKTVVLARIERLRELIEEDASALLLVMALEEIRRALDVWTRDGEQNEGVKTPASSEEPQRV
jgi:hypothetical protein